MAPLFCITLGPLQIKFFENCALVYGRSRHRPRGKHHLSLFAKPREQSGLMEPHVTCDDPGVASTRKKRIWFRYDPAAFRLFFERFEEEIVRTLVAGQIPVRLEELEGDGWFASFIPDDVADAEFAGHWRAKRVRVSLALMHRIFDLARNHTLPVIALDDLVDAAPADARRRSFALLRLNESEEIEHVFVGWRLGPEGERLWYLTPPGNVIDMDALGRFIADAWPAGFYKALLTIDEKLELDLDRAAIETLLRAADEREGRPNEQQRMTPALP